MATTPNRPIKSGQVKDTLYAWEGKDKQGKVVRGELRAGGEAIVNATLRRQGILVTKLIKVLSGTV